MTGFPLDNLRHLEEMLLDVLHSSGNLPLTLWKSDISDAYWLLPMHPLWQLKQTVSVDGEHYVNHNLAFGSSASAAIFISFNSLVAWIAKYVKGLEYLSNYVDDSSGCAFLDHTLLYEPYGKYLLVPQTRLLLL